jgi:hypothetical protein
MFSVDVEKLQTLDQSNERFLPDVFPSAPVQKQQRHHDCAQVLYITHNQRRRFQLEALEASVMAPEED